MILALAACADAPKPKKFGDAFEMKIGGKAFAAEIALTEAQKARGLMFRKSLGEDSAMIFVFDQPRRMSFWMKNTEIPLDIAFLTRDGEITEIKSMFARDLNPVKSSRGDILYCIEANAGWFSKNKISAGDRLDMRLLAEAVKQKKAAE